MTGDGTDDPFESDSHDDRGIPDTDRRRRVCRDGRPLAHTDPHASWIHWF